jgi:hypothetical protein
MNSYIFIDGPVLWVVVGIIIFLILIAAACSLVGTAAQIENEKLKRENANLKRALSLTQHEYYKKTFKVPEVDESV